MNKRILAIDDEAELLDAVAAWLESNGYEVKTAKNGLEGLGIAGLFKPHLIILDISMPKMDGFEVLTHLRQMQEMKEVPIVMLSGQGRTENIMEAERLKAVDFLLKPCRGEELLETVERHIGKP